jgi:hypothetical protein
LIDDHVPELCKCQILTAGADRCCCTLEQRQLIDPTRFFTVLIVIVR